MFLHNLKYTFKTLFKNKTLIFWTFAFPIVLGTLFYFAFSNIENSEKLNIIDIAIVNNEEFNSDDALKQTFSELSKEDSDEQLFSIKYVNEDEAKELLDKDKVTGYLIFKDNEPKVVIKQNGINETVFQYIVGEVIQSKEMVEDIAHNQIMEKMQKGETDIDYSAIYQNAISIINNQEVGIKDISSDNLSYTMIEYYTLIAMTCFYGATLGVYAINKMLANMSDNGKRVAVSPMKKRNLILSGVLASYIVQLIGLALLFVYTIIALKVDYGTRFLPVIILSLAGSLAGLTFGVAIGTLFKTNENNKIGIIISFTMLGSFLSGMMGITMKYIIDKNVPIINKLNPVGMITDGFYSLYYYSGLERYWSNVIGLLVFAFVMIALSFVVLRRQKYDSI